MIRELSGNSDSAESAQVSMTPEKRQCDAVLCTFFNKTAEYLRLWSTSSKVLKHAARPFRGHPTQNTSPVKITRDRAFHCARLPQRILFTMTKAVIAAVPEEEELIKKHLKTIVKHKKNVLAINFLQ
jgi:hypothetical protein